MIQFEFPDEPTWVTTESLDGVRYQLTFEYKERPDSWYLTIADQNGVIAYRGARLTTAVDLFRNYKRGNDSLPPGIFFVVSLTGSQELDPTFESFNEDFAFVYLTRDDIDDRADLVPSLELFPLTVSTP